MARTMRAWEGEGGEQSSGLRAGFAIFSCSHVICVLVADVVPSETELELVYMFCSLFNTLIRLVVRCLSVCRLSVQHQKDE
jgi:hypothetical protein